MDIQDRTIIEIVFARGWDVRFLSHLDTMRALSRALRRTGLNIYFTEGFNPKAKVSYLTPPLSVGHTSQCERVRFQVVGDSEARAEEAVRSALPPGYSLEKFSVLPPGAPKNAPVALKYAALVLAPDPSAAPGQVDESTPGIITPEQARKIRLMADPAENIAFMEKHFVSGVFLEIPLGEEYTKPEEIVKSIPGLEGMSVPLCYHRVEEVGKSRG